MVRERSSRRKDRPLVIVDIAMPRDIDSAVREVKGVFLYDLDDLENVVDHNAGEREAAAADAQKILQAEAQGFRRKLMAERVVPTIVALRQRLDEICRQELDSFRQENGPFSKDQDEMLNAVMSRMTQRIAGSLARELKELPEKVEQEQMTTAVQRLFHLQTPEPALAGTRSTDVRSKRRPATNQAIEQTHPIPRHWTDTQAYILAVFCLVLGVALGYLFRGSASPVAGDGRVGCRLRAESARQPQAPAGANRQADSRTAEGDGGPGCRALARDSEDQSR